MFKKLLVVLPVLFIAGSVYASSLWEYYRDRNEIMPSFKQRAVQAEAYGIVSDKNAYKGTVAQNKALLEAMNGDSPSVEGDNQLLGLMVDKLSKTIRESVTAGTNDTSINVDPLVTLQGHRLVQADVGDRLFFRIGSGDNVTWGYCTGMTDNTTYYTLTGCTLGLDDYGTSMATSTTNINSHSAGEPFVITNSHHWYVYYLPDKTSTQSISNIWTFSSYPKFSVTTTYPTLGAEFTTKQYVDNVGLQGAATSSEAQAGISELATQVENASSTLWGTTEPHVQQSQHATSTPYTGMTGLYDVWTENDGKISQNFIDKADAYTGSNAWSGLQTWTATTTFASSTFTSSTINNLNVPASSTSTLSKINVDQLGNNATTTIVSNLQINGAVNWTGSQYGATLIKTGQSSQAINTIGNQVITHNLGAVPSLIIIQGYSKGDNGGATSVMASNGTATSASDETCTYGSASDLSNVSGQASVMICMRDSGNNAVATASLDAVDNTTFTLNWSVNANTGLARTFQWSVFR